MAFPEFQYPPPLPEWIRFYVDDAKAGPAYPWADAITMEWSMKRALSFYRVPVNRHPPITVDLSKHQS